MRSWWHHEQVSIAAAVAAALHHSARPVTYKAPRGQKTATEEVEKTTHNVPRHQKTPLPGGRPGVQKDPAPQGAVTVGYVAAPGPLLAVPLLASTASEAVDNAALSFLLQQSLVEKRVMEAEEDGRKRMAELSLLWSVPYERRSAEQKKDRIMALLSRRKKKRKKKLPKTSSACGRARRRQRQWHARDAGFSGVVSPRRSVPFGCRQAQDARHHGRYGTEEHFCAPLCCSSRCVSFPVFRPEMLGIMAGLDQNDFWHVQGLTENFTVFYVYWWITDPEVDSRPSLFPYTAQCLVRPWIQIVRQFTENFEFFYVNRWIADPVVDSRPSLFPFAAQCLVRPWIQILRQSTENFTFFYVNRWITDPEVDSRLSFFPYTVHCLVRPWIQLLRQSTENFTFFYVNRWITDPEVESTENF